MNSDVNKWEQLHEQIKRANNEFYQHDHSTIDAAQKRGEVQKHVGDRVSNVQDAYVAHANVLIIFILQIIL
mgnify:CR=1 FL=1